MMASTGGMVAQSLALLPCSTGVLGLTPTKSNIYMVECVCSPGEFLWISSHTTETHWEVYWVPLKLSLMSISYRKHRLWALLRREIDVTGIVQDWKIWQFSFKNSATPFHGLWLVLQHLSIELNSAELQYHTQTVDMCGAVRQNSNHGFVILGNLQLWQSLYTATDYVCII